MTAGPRFGWVLNLDAELELASPYHTTKTRVVEQLAEHGGRALELLGPRDMLVTDLQNDPGLVGRAWCPTPRALAVLRSAGVEPEPHPSVSVLRRVNHRRFAFEVGGGLKHQRYVEDRAELDELLDVAARPWLLKRPLAFSGRGQMRAIGTLSQNQRGWIDASLRNDGLIIEPLVEPLLEVSLHGFVFPSGATELGRPCVQDVSERGVFRRVRLASSGDLDVAEERSLLESGERTAVALCDAGYFGPFGIDGFRYLLEGRQGFCALSEINARYTMGFATGFPRHPSEITLA